MKTSTQKKETDINGKDKVVRYGWIASDEKGRFEEISKSNIQIDESYQRPAAQDKILKISRDWSWVAFGTLTVCQRGQEYFAIDGQHRLLAAQNRSDIDLLPCLVFKKKSIQEEASAFVKVNTARKAMLTMHKHKALVKSGDAVANHIQSALDDLGIKIVKSVKSPLSFASIACAYKRYAESPEDFIQNLTMIQQICAKSKFPITERIFDGIWYINKNCSDRSTKERFRKRLITIGAERIDEGARRAATLYVKGGSTIWAKGILIEMNKNVSDKFYLSEKSN